MSQLHAEHEVQPNDSSVETVQQTWLHKVTSQTPWWLVSTVFHGLLIVLVGLVTMSIQMPDDERLIVVQPYSPPRAEETKIVESTSKGNALVPIVFDPTKPTNDIYIPQDIQNTYTLSNHIEKCDPLARPEEHGAGEGNLDAKILQFSSDPTGKNGGGGLNGHSLIEESVGVGLDLSAGTGGGRYFGNGTGSGPGDGPGMASYGNRMRGHRNLFAPYNPNGTRGFEEWDIGIKRALQWLAYHQEPDGHWDVKKYNAAHKNDTAITGLALLAFLGMGNTEKVGEHKDTVQRAVKWIIAHQGPDGLISDPTDDTSTHRRGGYPMAIATLALVEAAGMCNIKETHDAAQKAIDAVVNYQAGDGSDRMGWRYTPKAEGDLSVSGWFIMALKSAKVARLHVDTAVFEGAMHFLESVEVKDAGTDTGYGPPSRFKYMKSAEHAESAHRLTAIGTLARQFLGWKKEELQGSVDYFIQKGGVPAWGANGEKVDLYYWYYGSMASFQQGKESFGPWSAAMLKALLPNQRKDGDDNGSWDPVGEYSGEWGRVGQTALSALCLEVYIRFPRVYGK